MVEKKLSLTTSKDELFAGWRQLQRANIVAAEAEKEVYQRMYREWEWAQLGLAVGLIAPGELKQLVDKFIPLSGDLSRVISLARFWYQLSQSYPQVESELVLKIWTWALEGITDRYRMAAETAYYVKIVKPNDGEKRLLEAAERLREVVPSWERFPQIFSEDKVDRLGWLVAFLQNSAELGQVFPDLGQYLVACLENVDLNQVNHVSTEYLLLYLSKSGLAEAEKRRLINKVLYEVSGWPHEEKDGVYRAVAAGFLGIDDYENAVALWEMIKMDQELDLGLIDILVYALRQGKAPKARTLFSKYEQISGAGKDRNPRGEWRRCWFQAAYLATKMGPGFYLDQAEVTVGLMDGYGDSCLAQLWRLCREPQNQAKSGRIGGLIKKRACELVEEFNAGKLSRRQQQNTLELLLALEND